MIEAIKDMGKLDNTLIICIVGDNGSSTEGSPIGTPNEAAQFKGVTPPAKRSSNTSTMTGAPTRPITTWPWAGPGPSTPRTSGPSRSPRTSAAPVRAWSCPGRTASRTKAASATSSATASTSSRSHAPKGVYPSVRVKGLI
ncbi:MAG: hypothetical protein KAX51_04320 [Chromatiaceae bacterium]|nr:hypothetical protein [Chromatiaceae bacterium]MBP8284135.1 hypothetical protein [Chromatiaceae bacterium]MBP8289022.1 hypothetical protein [Chromatiaceae bacterium]